MLQNGRLKLKAIRRNSIMNVNIVYNINIINFIYNVEGKMKKLLLVSLLALLPLCFWSLRINAGEVRIDDEVSLLEETPGIALKDVEGYRGTKWGMSEKEVRSAIPDAKWEFGTFLFRDKILTYNATIKWHFVDNELTQVEIIISPEIGLFEDRKIKMTNAFNSLSKALSKKYGKPAETRSKTTKKVTAGIAWIFPSTEIGLEVYYMKGQPAWIILLYSKREIKEATPGEMEKL